jgi:hypothetical protein
MWLKYAENFLYDLLYANNSIYSVSGKGNWGNYNRTQKLFGKSEFICRHQLYKQIYINAES